MIASLGRNDQGNGVIQPTGHANDHVIAGSGLETAGYALHLYVERLITILVQLGGIIGNKRKAADDALQSYVIQCRLMVEGNPSTAPFRVFGSSSGIVEREIGRASCRESVLRSW